MRFWVVDTTEDDEPVDPGHCFDEADLWPALGLAVRAPSIHNSQLWRWRIGPRRVDLYTDLVRGCLDRSGRP
jgi:nitroreductase